MLPAVAGGLVNRGCPDAIPTRWSSRVDGERMAGVTDNTHLPGEPWRTHGERVAGVTGNTPLPGGTRCGGVVVRVGVIRGLPRLPCRIGGRRRC